jgi:hypothetical protein
MPNKDGTGPMGIKQRTGRGLGPCGLLNKNKKYGKYVKGIGNKNIVNKILKED